MVKAYMRETLEMKNHEASAKNQKNLLTVFHAL